MKLSALFALALVGSAQAFVPQSVTTAPSVVETSSTALPAGPPDTATKDIPYGETSRQFRRTVYTHDDWVKHRSPNRFVKNIFSLVNSGIYKVRDVQCDSMNFLCEYGLCLTLKETRDEIFLGSFLCHLSLPPPFPSCRRCW